MLHVSYPEAKAARGQVYAPFLDRAQASLFLQWLSGATQLAGHLKGARSW